MCKHDRIEVFIDNVSETPGIMQMTLRGRCKDCRMEGTIPMDLLAIDSDMVEWD